MVLYCLVCVNGVPIDKIMRELDESEYHIVLPDSQGDDIQYEPVGISDLKDGINFIYTSFSGVSSIKNIFRESNVKVRSIYLQSDEATRASELAKQVNDKTVLQYYDDYRLVPSIWGILTNDRKYTDVVMADYTVNANGSVSRTVSYIERIIND